MIPYPLLETIESRAQQAEEQIVRAIHNGNDDVNSLLHTFLKAFNLEQEHPEASSRTILQTFTRSNADLSAAETPFCFFLNLNFSEARMQRGFPGLARCVVGLDIHRSVYGSIDLHLTSEVEIAELKQMSGRLYRISAQSYILLFTHTGIVALPTGVINSILKPPITIFAQSFTHLLRDFLIYSAGDPQFQHSGENGTSAVSGFDCSHAIYFSIYRV
ncbi:MAG: hypothetical protein KDK34_08815 [Leptospiraceae bacterium]|nr:hypothetical protein [Leptospiraceae bacterium]